MTKDLCIVCDTLLPKLTTTCAGCGSVYRQGELVSEGTARPEQPRQRPGSMSRRAKTPVCPECGTRDCEKRGELYHKAFESWQRAETQEQAVERMYESYDKHLGRRRLPARETFEVVQVRHAWPLAKGEGPSLWIVYVRKRRQTSEPP